MLDAAAFNTDDIFWRVTYVSATLLHRLSWNKMSRPPLENFDFQDQFPQKINSILSGQLSTR
jgi:hypothetical protein